MVRSAKALTVALRASPLRMPTKLAVGPNFLRDRASRPSFNLLGTRWRRTLDGEFFIARIRAHRAARLLNEKACPRRPVVSGSKHQRDLEWRWKEPLVDSQVALRQQDLAVDVRVVPPKGIEAS